MRSLLERDDGPHAMEDYDIEQVITDFFSELFSTVAPSNLEDVLNCIET